VTHVMVARDALAFLCGLQGLATLAIDLNRTHATNPLWTPHARFHVVWQIANSALLAVLELALLLIPGRFQEERFYLVVLLACVPMIGFMAALIGRAGYDGALSDPNGIPPATLHIFARVLRIDLNLAAVVGGSLALAAIVLIYRL
jgi:hypothetical protein